MKSDMFRASQAGIYVFIALSLTASSHSFAARNDVPKEFIGDWVPSKASCNSPTRFRVSEKQVTLINNKDKASFGDLDICYSCEGGAKYSGIVVSLLPEIHKDNLAPFGVRFNADEKKGTTVIDMEDSELSKRFPLGNIALRKCPAKP